jgi:hypothetical protein
MGLTSKGNKSHQKLMCGKIIAGKATNHAQIKILKNIFVDSTSVFTVPHILQANDLDQSPH